MRGFVVSAPAVAILWAGFATAGDNVWTRLGPDDGAVSALATDPQNPATVYAATGAGLFKSDDEGANWGALKPGPLCCFAALLIHPQSSSTLYAVTRLGGSVLKSTDGGLNWSSVNSGLPVGEGGKYWVTSVAIDPRNPTTLYAGNNFRGSGGVLKTTDGGESWFPANSGLPDGGVMALAIDPRTPSTLYASTLKSGMFQTTDGGASWSAVNSGLETDIPRGYDYISVLAINPQDPNTLYAGRHYADCEDCGTALFKTADAGASWTPVARGLGPGNVLALAIDSQDQGTVYAGTTAGLFKTTNAGATWSPSKTRQTADINGRVVIPALAIDPTNPDTVYAAEIYTGILKTTDAGANWTAVNADLRSTAPTDILALRIAPQDPTTIYAGTDAGMFKTTDSGANWTAVNAGLPYTPYGHLPVSIMALDPQASSTLYIVDPGWQDIFRSTDGGATWAPTLARDSSGLVVRGARLNTNAFAIDPRNPRTLYVAGSYIQSGQPSGGTGVIKSTDGGASWSVMSSGLPAPSNSTGIVIASLATDPQSPGTVYAGTWVQNLFGRGNGVFKTTNGGGSWTNVGLAGYTHVDVLAVDPKSQGTLYARAVVFGQTSRLSWLFKTTNGGASWTEVDSGLPGYVNALEIDPQNPRTLYAGSASGAFRSSDGGAGWSALNDGLPTLSVNTLAIDQSNPNRVYAGTAGGVYSITYIP